MQKLPQRAPEPSFVSGGLGLLPQSPHVITPTYYCKSVEYIFSANVSYYPQKRTK